MRAYSVMLYILCFCFSLIALQATGLFGASGPVPSINQTQYNKDYYTNKTTSLGPTGITIFDGAIGTGNMIFQGASTVIGSFTSVLDIPGILKGAPPKGFGFDPLIVDSITAVMVIIFVFGILNFISQRYSGE